MKTNGCKQTKNMFKSPVTSKPSNGLLMSKEEVEDYK